MDTPQLTSGRAVLSKSLKSLPRRSPHPQPPYPHTIAAFKGGMVLKSNLSWRGIASFLNPARLLRRLWRAIQRHYGSAWSASIRPANHALWCLNCPQLKSLVMSSRRTGLSSPRWRLGTLRQMKPTPLRAFWRPSAVPLRLVSLRPA